MELRFRHRDETVTIEVSPENTIEEIREKLSDIIGIIDFSLFLDDQQLEDSAKIQETRSHQNLLFKFIKRYHKNKNSFKKQQDSESLIR